ncbi:hypothetical protein AC579_1570 [Pseudocercospora musae]|uniref:mRNA-capping enzyme subunit beta n=1 Tax=Pseudocercospora musae TaxID=113226 RepID=A0A139I1X4_9PEZI|nr:hypothetical protein AC579_1570 [Pseudocercospora musae]
MDLKGMLNDGAAPEEKSSQGSPLPTPAGRSSGPQTAPPPPPGPNGAPPSAGAYAPAHSASQQSTPLYPPPPASAGPPGNPQSRGLTPLQTPGHAPSSGQYPFPYQPAQSPAAAPGQQPYRAYEPYSATTPGPRPPSHAYPLTNPSPSHYNQTLHHPHTASHSPTPSSHHSQTPHSVRQSPLSHIPQQPPQPLSHQYQHSQPSTPLGPPPHIPRHGANQFDTGSPFHTRTFSGASNGAMASPAQHQASIGSLIQSPSAHHRPSPQRRSGSDYHSQTERERSLSVSPKTMVPPRPPSLGSRHSSQNDVYSARSSMQPSSNMAPHPETPNHVQPPTPSYAQPQSSCPPSNVPQGHPQAYRQILGHSAVDSLSAAHNQIPLQHSPQKMGMNHLLAPTDHGAPLQNGAPAPAAYHNMSSQSQSDRNQQTSHAASAIPTHAQPPRETQVKSEPTKSEHTMSAPHQSDAYPQYPSTSQHPSNGMAPTAMDQKPNLKRSAESDLSNGPPVKRERRSRYTERPVWANLDPRNPRARQSGVVPNGTAGKAAKPRPQGAVNGAAPQQQQVPTPAPAVQMNGNRQHAGNAPLDTQLIATRNLLGPWERCMFGQTNMPSTVKAVADWLHAQFEMLQDVGYDPRESAIEIEGKIGTLCQDNGSRFSLPVRNMVVLDPSSPQYKSLRFESQMVDKEHKNMNAFLNTKVQDSHREPGREKIIYKHLHEIDSFRTMTDAGIRLLPESILRRNSRRQRDLKLRTTTDMRTNQVTARIVKVKVDDLHIYSPQDPYDMRISINIECNLARPDIDPQAITKKPAADEPVQPDRRKDRLSYKHLQKYSVDLTRVDQAGMAPKYELEIEVDANSLRQEWHKLMHGQPSGYTDIVDGFMENAQWLMKQPRH